MLIARTTLGVALPEPSSMSEETLRRAAEAGAGAVRARWTGEVPLVPATADGLEVLWTVRPWERGRPARIASGTDAGGTPALPVIEIEVASDADREALPEVLGQVGEGEVVLGLGAVSLADLPTPVVLPPLPRERVAAFSVAVEGMPETADPKRMEDALRALAGPLRADGWRQPFWLTDLAPAGGVAPEEHAGWLVRHAAHALALSMPRVFLRLPEGDPEPVFQALRMLAVWLEGADRITWLARGQYRAEFTGRPSRFLLWAEPGITRLPSSFQGPLHSRDLSGDERPVDTTRLKLSEIPLLVERRGGDRPD